MASLLTLKEAKEALRLRDTDAARDELLKAFIEGVTSVVEAQVGWVTQRTETLQIRQGDWPRRGSRPQYEFALPGFNVISLTSGVYDRTQEAVDVSGMVVGVGGVLRNLSGAALPLEPWTLTLEVGMTPIPPAIKRAAGEILLLAWETQRQIPGDNNWTTFLVASRAADWFAGYETGPGFA